MKFTAVVLFLLIFSNIKSDAQAYQFKDGKVSFFSEAPIENIEAHSNSFASVLNTSSNEIAFMVSIRSFEFKKQLMQEHFNERYMESDKYPYAAYKGKINEKIDWTKNGTYTITAQGALTIHGVKKERTDTAQVVIADGKITVSGRFLVKVADHNIAIPKVVFQSIAEVIRVEFSGEYPLPKSN